MNCVCASSLLLGNCVRSHGTCLVHAHAHSLVKATRGKMTCTHRHKNFRSKTTLPYRNNYAPSLSGNGQAMRRRRKSFREGEIIFIGTIIGSRAERASGGVARTRVASAADRGGDAEMERNWITWMTFIPSFFFLSLPPLM